jgi:hypothetical protein
METVDKCRAVAEGVLEMAKQGITETRQLTHEEGGWDMGKFRGNRGKELIKALREMYPDWA